MGTERSKNTDNTSATDNSRHDDDQASSLGWLGIILTTFAAAFGVQSNKNRQRDFKHGRIGPYIAAGIIFTVLFVIGVSSLVSFILQANGL